MLYTFTFIIIIIIIYQTISDWRTGLRHWKHASPRWTVCGVAVYMLKTCIM